MIHPVRTGAILLTLAATGTVCLLSLGCSTADGPPRYHVSGSVTYQGKPVPGGRIMFEPDATQGNSGPGAVAEISEGRYATRSDRGVVGGPHRVTIYGTDGTVATEERDNALFVPYRTEVDLPEADTTHDFSIEQPSGQGALNHRLPVGQHPREVTLAIWADRRAVMRRLAREVVFLYHALPSRVRLNP